MKGKGRKRPAKRTRSAHGRQQSLKLRKEVQELYDPTGDTDSTDQLWDSYTAPDPPKRGRLAKAPPEPTPPPSTAQAGTSRPSTGDPPAIVVSLYSGGCFVEKAGEICECVLPSSLARHQRSALAVGDEVALETVPGQMARVTGIHPRRTTLSRPDPQNPRLERVIAANIDIAVLTVSLRRPDLRPALVDRYLIAIERSGAQALLVVNKIDLVPDPEQRQRELALLEPYRRLVLDILPCDAHRGEGIETLRRALTGSTAAFVGHSGVGKSSLITALDPDLDLATGSVGGPSGAGRHTTTRSDLFHLRGGIRLIDTPGIRELGLWRLDLDELRAYFPEFDAAAADCHFTNCSHSHEPVCGVRRAVDDGRIEARRFATYQRILDSLRDEGT